MPRWMEPVIPHLHLEASPAAEEAAPEPALTGASGHPAEPPAGQSRPRPGRRTSAPTPGKPESRHPRACTGTATAVQEGDG